MIRKYGEDRLHAVEAETLPHLHAGQVPQPCRVTGLPPDGGVTHLLVIHFPTVSLLAGKLSLRVRSTPGGGGARAAASRVAP